MSVCGLSSFNAQQHEVVTPISPPIGAVRRGTAEAGLEDAGQELISTSGWSLNIIHGVIFQEERLLDDGIASAIVSRKRFGPPSR